MSGIILKDRPYNQWLTPAVFSDYNGVHKPIIYEFFRADIYQCSTQNEGGKIGISANGFEDFSELVVGDQVEVILFEFNDYKYDIIEYYNVPIFTYTSSTLIVIDKPFTTVELCVVNVLKRANWKLNTKVKGLKLGDTIFSTIANITSQTKEGVVKINVAPFLKSLVLMNDDVMDYTNNAESWAIRPMCYDYYLEFLITWDEDSSTDVLGYVEDFSHYFNGVKQIGEEFGNNFADYYWQIENSNKAKIFNGLFNKDDILQKSLSYFYGLPFSFGYFAIYVTRYDLYYVIEEFDINGNSLALTNYPLIALDGQFRKVTVKTNKITNPLTSYFTLHFKMVKDDLSNEKIATYKYKYDVVRRDCDDNFVYLNWLHPTGARMYYLFERNHEKGIITKTIETYNPYFEDIETQTGDIFITGKETTPTMKVGGVTTKEKFQWLQTLFYSTNVLMLTNLGGWEIMGAKWINVNIPDNSLVLENATDTTVEFSFNLILPKINTQSE